jgi:hypothetical protein
LRRLYDLDGLLRRWHRGITLECWFRVMPGMEWATPLSTQPRVPEWPDLAARMYLQPSLSQMIGEDGTVVVGEC